MCSDVRQEFILLSDVLGVSMLVETINHRTGRRRHRVHRARARSTWSTSPPRELGANIALDGKGRALPGHRRGSPGPAAHRWPARTVDVWQANDDGFYDVQQPGVQPERNLRGLFTTDADGRVRFRSVVPRLLPDPGRRAGRASCWRPPDGTRTGRRMCTSIVRAQGYRPVTTHLFVADTPYLDSDAVFGVKDSLVREFPVVDDAARAAEAGVPNPFRTVHFDVVLRPVEGS